MEEHLHAHRHGHEHNQRLTSLNKSFLLGISLNLAFVGVEFGMGLYYGSLGLLSDAGHNLSDVAGLVLAMLAFRLEKLRPNDRYTYGYRRSTILVSLLNAVILLIAVGFIVGESLEKLFRPVPVEGLAIVWTAGAGVVVNAFTAWLFLKDKERDLNVKGAYLHMMADALVSVGVAVSGVAIMLTGQTVVDPVIGLVVAAVIVASTWGLLRDSIRLSLDGVPKGLDIRRVRETLLSVEGVAACHHLHVWALSTTEVALTAHLVVERMDRMEAIKQEIRHALLEQGIHHVTLEPEDGESRCSDECSCS